MRYSLLSRFQGGMLASLMGASLVNDSSSSLGIDQNLSLEINLGMSLTQRLIETGQVSKSDWQELAEQYGKMLNFKSIAPSGIIALITLPLTLFFHDNLFKFQQQLHYLNEIWPQSAETLEEVVYWQDILSLILREKLNPSLLIPTLLETHSLGNTSFRQQLEQVQGFLEARITLKQAISQLGAYPLVLAYYCFICTPEDIHLCILRGRQTPYQPALTGALTGMLAGVYNSINGIPIPWQLKTQQMPIIQTAYQQAAALFAVWSGVFHLDPHTLPDYALASPLVIQPR